MSTARIQHELQSDDEDKDLVRILQMPSFIRKIELNAYLARSTPNTCSISKLIRVHTRSCPDYVSDTIVLIDNENLGRLISTLADLDETLAHVSSDKQPGLIANIGKDVQPRMRV